MTLSYIIFSSNLENEVDLWEGNFVLIVDQMP